MILYHNVEVCLELCFHREMANITFRTTIEDVFACMICLDEVTDAHLCPSCARSACRQCWHSLFISSYLCPCCRSDLSQLQLVRCGWFADLRSEVQECSNEKNQLENDLAIALVQSDVERALLEEEREQLWEEKLIFDAERDSLIEAQLQEEQEEITESEISAVEREIIEAEQNNEIADLLDLAMAIGDQGEDSCSSIIYREVDTLLQQMTLK